MLEVAEREGISEEELDVEDFKEFLAENLGENYDFEKWVVNYNLEGTLTTIRFERRRYETDSSPSAEFSLYETH